jgi:hypothetical protein
MVTMRPPSPINFDAAPIAAITPWRLIASCRASATVSELWIIDATADRNASIADEDVEPSEILRHLLHQLIDFPFRGLVRLIGACLHTVGLQLGDTRFGALRRSDVADGDTGAFICKRLCGGRADAARSAGDESNLRASWSLNSSVRKKYDKLLDIRLARSGCLLLPSFCRIALPSFRRAEVHVNFFHAPVEDPAS